MRCRFGEIADLGKLSLFSQPFSVKKSFLHSGCYASFQPGNYSGRKHSSVLYCSWKCGLGFWHSRDLFSPGQNGKSDVVSETPTEGRERGGDEKTVSGFPSGSTRARSRGELLGPLSLGLSAGAVWTSPGSKPESPCACLQAAGSFCLCISACRTQR